MVYRPSPYDQKAAFKDQQRRIRRASRQAPINNASVTSGTGVRITIPAGMRLEDVATMVANLLVVNASDSSLRTPGHVQGGYLKSDGDITSDGITRAYGGVMAEVDGQMQQLGPQIGATKSLAGDAKQVADAAYDLAGSKPTKAYVDAGDSAAMEKAQEALDAAGGDPKPGATLQTPNLISPKITGITAGGQDSTWVPLLVNKSTGALRSYGSGPIG